MKKPRKSGKTQKPELFVRVEGTPGKLRACVVNRKNNAVSFSLFSDEEDDDVVLHWVEDLAQVLGVPVVNKSQRHSCGNCVHRIEKDSGEENAE
jgi:hypothetical protein